MNTPRIYRLLKIKVFASVVSMFLGILTGISISQIFFGTSAVGFIAGLITAFVTMKFLNFLSLAYLQYMFYGPDSAAFIKEYNEVVYGPGDGETPIPPNSVPIEEMVLTIVKTPEKPSGKFMDVPFFEWLDIRGDDGALHRFNFFGTVDMSKGIPAHIPTGTVLIPPGIYYQVEENINTST